MKFLQSAGGTERRLSPLGEARTLRKSSLAQHLRPESTGGILLIDKTGAVTSFSVEGSEWRVPRSGKTLPLNQRFSQMWQIPRKILRRLSFETALRRALDRGELVVHLQPKADVATGQIVGAEALVRWLDPDRGVVWPVDFIPEAEDSGLIDRVDEYVLKAVCSQSRIRQSAGIAQVPVSVNISALHLRDAALPKLVASLLEQADLGPDCLELEITETAAMAATRQVAATLQSLRELGVRIAIDDFGRGYFSFLHLRSLPIQVLKLDGSLIRDVGVDSAASDVVTAIIAMASNLGLEVVAEGVETTNQLEFLKQERCNLFQGYLLAEAMPSEDFDRVLSKQSRLYPAAAESQSGRQAA
jgi:EAL domain-containing protein (putative c-di-GMP-specific phosphodiesterase class I)